VANVSDDRSLIKNEEINIMFKNNSGFTLIEMLIVLTIISVLLILIVPNFGKSNQEVHKQGCDALVSVVQSQVYLYHLETGHYPTDLTDLTKDNYITDDQTTCANGKTIEVDTNGVVNAN